MKIHVPVFAPYGLEELRVIVIQLGQALNLSEQRTTRLERIIRWSTISITLFLGLALTVTLQTFGYAESHPVMEPSKTVEQSIDRLTQKLTGPESTLGQMGMLMNNMIISEVHRAKKEAKAMPPAMAKEDCAIATNPDNNRAVSEEVRDARILYPLGYFTKCYFLDNAIELVNGDYDDKHYQAAVVTAMGGVAVEAGVLMYRIRHDSDFIQGI